MDAGPKLCRRDREINTNSSDIQKSLASKAMQQNNLNNVLDRGHMYWDNELMIIN